MARSRSRSPGRQARKSKGGFAWKDTKPKDDPNAASDRRHDEGDERRDGRSDARERDHRQRDGENDDARYRRRERDRDSERRRDRDYEAGRGRRRGDGDARPDRGDHDNSVRLSGNPEYEKEIVNRKDDDRRPERSVEAPQQDNSHGNDIASKFGVSAAAGIDIASKFGSSAASKISAAPTSVSATENPPSSTSKSNKPKKARAAVATGPMILVTVNDRLGTKAQIPCLASDTVGDFKKIVAMKIGRRPHEIMIKRQSERPFKDQLTLEDYGVSSGVQLDLELDTGD